MWNWILEIWSNNNIHGEYINIQLWNYCWLNRKLGRVLFALVSTIAHPINKWKFVHSCFELIDVLYNRSIKVVCWCTSKTSVKLTFMNSLSAAQTHNKKLIKHIFPIAVNYIRYQVYLSRETDARWAKAVSLWLSPLFWLLCDTVAFLKKLAQCLQTKQSLRVW